MRYLTYLDELNANCLRIYTLLPPGFYTAFKQFNDERVAAGVDPILLLHGVWTPDDQLNANPAGVDAFDSDIVTLFYQNMAGVVGAVHAGGSFEVRAPGPP